ncbi:type VI secretion system-associated FHA domain protein TagH [Rhodobacteraceae bacterium CCMM004]|nr:type VI secretion system-associated FHA domain protein TagH [Rhodobacteraceae bacterium CCMM004]
MVVTLHFQSTGTVPGNAQPVRMVGTSLTVGRGQDNDLVLPDPDRTISKHHCAIENHGGNVVVVDLSTNGTFRNYGKTPLGKVPTPLNDGDILSLGNYELLVEIQGPARADPTAMAPAAAPAQVSPGRPDDGGLGDILDDSGGGQDFLDDLLGDPGQPAGPGAVHRPAPADDDGLLPPLDDDDFFARPAETGQGASHDDSAPSVHDSFAPAGHAAQPIPEDWGDDFLSDLTPTAPPPSTDPFAEPEPEPVAPPPDAAAPPAPGDAAPPAPDPGGETQVPVPPAAAAAPQAPPADPAPPPPASVTGGGESARAFLKAAGAEGLKVPDDELVPTMARMGHVLRIMIHGMREILMTRRSIKSEFRIEQTQIGRGGNNPLKWSISPEQAVEAMIRPTTTGYLDATAAAEEALSDIRAHEMAVMSGMEAALKGVLAQLSPAELEKQMAAGGGAGGFLKGKKARYWETYEKMFAQISDQAENDFHDLFAREFSRAYQDQLERLK